MEVGVRLRVEWKTLFDLCVYGAKHLFVKHLDRALYVKHLDTFQGQESASKWFSKGKKNMKTMSTMLTTRMSSMLIGAFMVQNTCLREWQSNVGGCPREPWHDLHSKLDGPATYDVLTNFEERWLKVAKPQGIKKLKSSFNEALLRLEGVPDIISVSDAPSVGDDNPEAWHVQIFCSTDSSSVKGFPKDPKDASSKNLVCGKNVLIDMSIHTEYVKAICAAQHYIYIENQYFIGSSYNWSQYKDLDVSVRQRVRNCI